MSAIVPTFLAYPSAPSLVGDTVERAIGNLKEKSGIEDVHSWREADVAGRFIAEQVLNKIEGAQAFVADVTQLNFNVTYEVGFALAKGKRVVLIRHKGIQPSPPLVGDVGIFDTLGYLQYQNADELEAIIRRITDPSPSLKNIYPLNRNAPLYLIAARLRTDPVTRIISRVKKAKLFFRSFDPQETPRLSAADAFEQTAQSFGVLVHLLPERIADSSIHNIQSAFLAGLADGFEKVLLMLQDGEEPIPIDYRDLATVFLHPSQIDDAIAEFAPKVTEAMQERGQFAFDREQTLLEKITFGASAAENEFRELAAYYFGYGSIPASVKGRSSACGGQKRVGKDGDFRTGARSYSAE
jgi:hypothetical protein